METIKGIVAANITELRAARGMTQMELAERLNYSDKAVSKWERGESLPDVATLNAIARIFGVTLDYLVQEEHRTEDVPVAEEVRKHRRRNRSIIAGMSILLVWLAAELIFVLVDLVSVYDAHWLAFVYAVPATMVVWLIFNCIWFNRRRNFLIISLLMWTLLTAVFVTFLAIGHNVWMIFLLGIPGQLIIIMWSGLK